MIDTLQNISSFLYLLLPFSLGVTLIGLVLCLIVRILKNDTLRIIGMALIVQCFVLGLILVVIQNLTMKEIRNEVKGILADPKTELQMDTADFTSIQPEELKRELLKLKDISTNHSYPKDKKTIRVISPSGNFNLFIAEDSNDAKEFWIFTDKYNLGLETEIGKIKL